MKIVGLITEYNPFHNGHKYHIEKAKEITGADYVIAVMSGDFVQRGAPSIMPKHLRTAMALDGGCDMVLELPVCYATGSAEYFASGAVSILDNLGCVDALCFGSECGDYTTLETIANVLTCEPDKYKLSLQKHLKNGYSFPFARHQALSEYFQDEFITSILKNPNNILGIEYIKALLVRNSLMTGYTITRQGSGYHETKLYEKYSSASAIRNYFENNIYPVYSELQECLSENTLSLLKEHYMLRYPVYLDDFSLILKYKLLSESKESLTQYLDVTPDIANRIINRRNDFLSITQFIELIKTKEITHSRISRCLIHILLNLKDDCLLTDTYARVLGFKSKSSELFSIIKECSQIPLITKVGTVKQLTSEQISLLSQDIFASDLYESIISDKFKTSFINELTKQIVKI